MRRLFELWKSFQRWREQREDDRILRIAVHVHIDQEHGGSFLTCQKGYCPAIVEMLIRHKEERNEQ